MAANASTIVTVTLMTDLDKPLRAYLIAAGWTPPGETPDPAGDHTPIAIAEHRRILDAQAVRHHKAMRDLQQGHMADMGQQEVNHHEAMSKLQERHLLELGRQANDHNEELRSREARVRAEYSPGGGHDDCVSRSVHDQKLRDQAKHMRTIVANEIAADLVKRSWRITNENPSDVALSHAAPRQDLPFPTGGIPWATTAGEKS